MLLIPKEFIFAIVAINVPQFSLSLRAIQFHYQIAEA